MRAEIPMQRRAVHANQRAKIQRSPRRIQLITISAKTITSDLFYRLNGRRIRDRRAAVFRGSSCFRRFDVLQTV